jgi:hypothetical protein
MDMGMHVTAGMARACDFKAIEWGKQSKEGSMRHD